MSNSSDFPKLSTFVEGIVDRKVRSIALGITTSTGYFKNLLSQASVYALAAGNSAAESARYAEQAMTSATQSAIVYNQFTSLYLGVSVNEPQRSSLGNFVTPGAFYIRQDDRRLRFAQSVSADGTVTYADATVAADSSSIDEQLEGRFLSLGNRPAQSVRSPVIFGGTVTVPPIPEWETSSPPQGSQVLFLVNTVNNRLTDETNRAQAAESQGVRFTQSEIDRAKAVESAILTRIDSIDGSRTPDTGVTRNGAFNTGTTDWNVGEGMTWISSPGDYHGIIRAGATESRRAIISHRHYVREDRTYRVRIRFASRGFNIGHYAGVQCYNEAGTHLGNIYMPPTSGQKQPYDWLTYEGFFSGFIDYGPTPVFVGGGSKFPIGTVSVELLFLPNYELGEASGPIITDLDYFYMEDASDFTTTNVALTSEVNRAVARENDLATQIQQERVDRTNGDLYCERLVNDERASRLAEVQQERVDRNNQDFDIQNRITNEANTRYGDDLRERGERQAEIQQERVDRVAGDTYCENLVNTERAARLAEVQQERVDRNGEDVRIISRLAAEEGERARVDTYLDQRITNEGGERARVDEVLSVRINAEINDRKAEVNQERVDRYNGDNTNLAAIGDERNRAMARENGIEGFAIALSGRVDQHDTDIAALKRTSNNSGANQWGEWERRGNIVEMWGTVIRSSTSEISVPVTLPLVVDGGTFYTISLTPMTQTVGRTQDLWVQLVYNTISSTGFYVQYQSDDGDDNLLFGFTWRVIFRGSATNEASAPTAGGSAPSNGGAVNCPEGITPVLMANAERTGPGDYVRADSVTPGDYVWTRHEDTMVEGAYEVTHARVFDGVLWYADGYYRATKGHPLYINDRWVTIDELGVESGEGEAVAITVDGAHTYYTLGLNGQPVLNHNVKAVQQP